MNLRGQLVLVSLLVLLLPWAGCSYVSEMENALRQGQQDALVSVTQSIASMINGRPDLFEELLAADRLTTTGMDVYLHEAPRGLIVDGYADDGSDFSADMVNYPPSTEHTDQGRKPLKLSVWHATHGEYMYVYAHIEDTGIRFRSPVNNEVSGSDNLQLVLENTEGKLQRYWISPEGPGEFTALRLSGRRYVGEHRIRGTWRDTADGYTVELMLPRSWVHNRFGIVAVDGEDARRWSGSMAPGTDPGRLITISKTITEQLGVIAQGNLRVSIVDNYQWLRAISGSLSLKPDTRVTPLPGAWMLEALYRLAVPGPEDGFEYWQSTQGRLQRQEVRRALAGESAATWYPTDSENNLAIISASMPLWHEDRIIGAVIAEQTSAGILSLTNAALVRLAGVSSVLVLLIVAGLIGYASWLSVRIHRLSRQVSRVMEPEGRELNAFPLQTAKDEIGTLGRSFERLLSNVRAYTDYLQTLASKLSHELRTPLAVVRTSLDNLEHEAVSPGAEQYLRRAREGSERLNRILNAMSEASRVERSISSAETAAVNLNGLLEDVVAGYRTVYPNCNIEYELPNEGITIDGNAELLAQMLDKLMDNACDFCPVDGVIRFGLARQGGEVVISVENDGPLLPPAMADQLFESMVSVREGKDEHVHMGLGLTIVRLVAEFHGGVATARNRSDGSGVIILIRIPQTVG